MALPGSGAISASMIRTELNIPSQVPFSLSSASLVHYSDLNALSISSSNDTLDITNPNAIGEWKNYDHSFTRSLAPYSGLRIPFGYPYSTFAQVNIGTTSAVIPFTASNFVSSGTAPSNEVTYSIFYSTYSLDMVGKSEFIQRGVLTSAAPSSSFTFNYSANSGSVVTFLFRNIVAAWSECPNMSRARESLVGVGNNNSALVFGGATPTILSCTEIFSTFPFVWNSGPNLITGRAQLGGAGTQNAALAFGGCSPTVSQCTEEYDGATWTAGGNLIYCRQELAGVGTQNAALAVGGQERPNVLAFAIPEEYNGTTWTAGNPMGFARAGSGGAGTQNAAIIIGGCKTSPIDAYFTCTEKYDGTTWSAASTVSGVRAFLGSSGTQNSTLIFGGQYCTCIPGDPNCYVYTRIDTQYYDGVTWRTETNMPSTRTRLGGTGGSTIKGGGAFAFGGSTIDNPDFPNSRTMHKSSCAYLIGSV